MKKEINIDGKIYRLVEKMELEIGKWVSGIKFSSGKRFWCLTLADGKHVGFIEDEWGDLLMHSKDDIKLTDIKEVEKLLIDTCVNKYKDAKKVLCPHREPYFDVDVSSLRVTFNSNGVFVYMPSTYDPTLLSIHFDIGNGKSDISWAEIIEEKKPSLYIIKITETTKSFPKSTYYKCEIGGTLQDVVNKKDAFVFECIEAAENIAEFIDDTYDFKSTIIDL